MPFYLYSFKKREVKRGRPKWFYFSDVGKDPDGDLVKIKNSLLHRGTIVVRTNVVSIDEKVYTDLVGAML